MFDLKAGLMGVLTLVIGALVVLAAVFVGCILFALMGAIAGFIVSITPVLNTLVISGFAALGIANVDLVSMGATLGFIGGFFKSINYNKG